ncbi:MAG: hypothetical protein P4L63_02645 [Candidatus Pacebacteria bacterium]|nr:hypothetical protein [Candidatus Paceibacterota bacterium]
MIYLFYGDDTEKKFSVYEKFIKATPQNTETLFISRNNFNPMQIESLYSGSGLFYGKSTIVFSGILENEETRNFLLDRLNLMGDANNVFAFLEGKLNKPVIDIFKKARAELNYFELPKEKKEKFDNFLVANAFANKDKLNTWIYFRQAIDLGASLEEINGIIFWKVKDMILKKNFSKFKEEQLKTLISRLSYLLPEARKNGQDAEAALEKFLLEAF